MAEIKVDILSPARKLTTTTCNELRVPSTTGQIGILPGHAGLLTEIGVGELLVVSQKASQKLFVSGGFVEVKNDEVRVLVDIAEKPDEIDVERAKKAQQRAEERLKKTADGDVDFVRAQASLLRSIERQSVAGAL